jgi:hypothetical protein
VSDLAKVKAAKVGQVLVLVFPVVAGAPRRKWMESPVAYRVTSPATATDKMEGAGSFTLEVEAVDRRHPPARLLLRPNFPKYPQLLQVYGRVGLTTGHPFALAPPPTGPIAVPQSPVRKTITALAARLGGGRRAETVVLASLVKKEWATLYDYFGSEAAPVPGDKRYKKPPRTKDSVAAEWREIIETIQALWTSAPGAMMAILQYAGRLDEVGEGLGDESLLEYGWSPEELGWLIGTHAWDLNGDDVAALIQQVSPDGTAQLEAELVEWALWRFGHKDKLWLCPVDKARATAWVAAHHSKLGKLNPRGLMYTLGCCRGEELVAVAAAGTPSGFRGCPGCHQHGALELSRVASDGTTRNASSMLTSRMIDLVPTSGRAGHPGRLFLTYSLVGERGAPYRALRQLGLRPVLLTNPAAKASGSRAKSGASSLKSVPKVRWEAGPAAAVARWDLLTVTLKAHRKMTRKQRKALATRQVAA